jgi:2-polyprenyl-3-methyl-5-hydroxy-6-metoxy-1,4-benzoquinol methylase
MSMLRRVGFVRDSNGVFVKSKGEESAKLSFPVTTYDDFDERTLDSFWVKLRADAILQELRSHEANSLIEIGAGSGYVSLPLISAGIDVISVEPIYSGAQIITARGGLAINATLEELNLPDDQIAYVGIFDVLEHIEQDELFLRQLYKSLKPGGWLFLTVPAHNSLYSDFDSSIGHYRRYSKFRLTELLKRTGFEVHTARFLFHSLVFPAFILRRIPYLFGRRKKFDGEHGFKVVCENSLKLSPFLNKVLYRFIKFENHLKLPFGLSLIAASQKPEA